MTDDPDAVASTRPRSPATARPLAGYARAAFRLGGGRRRRPPITLNRPERKNPLTFDSYAELRDLFARAAATPTTCKAVVVTGAGDNFCSGGDVHEIIGPLVRLKAPELLMFTRMTGDLVKAMRACPQPIVAAIDGVCAGAGAIIAMASDLRLGTARSKTAFLFNRVGLAGCDMGACAMLPRIIGQGRASELLYTGRALGGEEGERWGFFNRLVRARALLAEAQALARELAAGPTFANGITKTHAAPGMGDDDRAGDRGRGAGAGDLHADRGFHARLRRVRRPSRSRASRATDMTDERPHATSTGRSSRTRHRALARRARRLGRAARAARPRRATSTPPAARSCARSARPAGCATRSPARAYGGAADAIDTRAICLIRETLARHAGLADFAFAMQGLGSGAISLAGTPAQKAALPAARRARRGDRRLRAVRARRRLRRRRAGVRARASTATHYVLDGEKTWISNGGIADFYVVFARTGEAPGARGISAFIVDAGTPGFEIAERIDVIAPHPLARLRFTNCRVPATQPHRRARARASRSRCARSTSSAPRSPPPRSASRAARSTRRCSARPRARCSARRSPTSSSRRPSSRRWRPPSTAPRC